MAIILGRKTGGAGASGQAGGSLSGTYPDPNIPTFPYLATGRYYALDSYYGSTSGQVMTVNTMYVYPVIIYRTTSFDRISFQCSVGGGSGSVVRLGVYADNNGLPDALIADWDTVVSTGTTVVEATIAWSPTPGIYWIAGVAQVGTQPTAHAVINAATSYLVGHTSPDTNFQHAMYVCQTNVSGALPDPASVTSLIQRHIINKFRVA
jgi:hypothetical protein